MTTIPDIIIGGWREAGSCFDRTDVDFFPEADDSVAVGVAVSECASCPVAAECLTWAIETDQREGIWGGYLPAERRTIRRGWLEEIRRAS
jgi:WhiB family transcriptional regulator, redox-sensing transcriptional regulator